MKYSEMLKGCTELFNVTVATPVYISGSPGSAKTSLCYEVAEQIGIQAEAVFLFRPSLHDPVDLNGVPHVTEQGTTRWAVPKFLQMVNDAAEKHGRAMLIWDELPQAVIMMQNAIAGCLLDRVIGDFKLHPSVVQIATGNRTTDKAGANRVVSQLANRVMRLEMDIDLDDWVMWALGQKLDPVDVAFLQFKASLLCDFDPNRFSNPTPRSWHKAFMVPKNVGQGIYFAMISGLVGEGAATEYVAYKEIADKVVTAKEILANPTKVQVPNKPAALYAVCGSLAAAVNKSNFGKACEFLERIPPEFQALCVKSACQLHRDEISMTPAFTKWVHNNQKVLVD